MGKQIYYCAALAAALWRVPVQAQPAKSHQVPNLYQAVDARVGQMPDSSAKTVESLARFIKGSFATEADKARAAFVWVAKNIRYDVENQYAITFFRDPAEVAHEALARRKGVCTHYAELYSAVANQAGLKTFVVPGYTKSNGEIAQVAHAWCATRIDGVWYLMDPTWAAGAVVHDAFVPRLNNEYFRPSAAAMGRSHLPFDPLWQLVTAPRTAAQFQKGATAIPTVPAFSFADSVAAYEQQSPLSRLRATNRRVKQNGVHNGLIFNFLASNVQLEENYHIAAYNEALGAFNAGINKLNAFVDYFNRQFLPKKPDAELQQLLAPVVADFAHSRQRLATARGGADASNAALMQEFEMALRQAETKTRDCQAFMERYLHAGKLVRPLLFRSISGPNEVAR